MDRLISCERQHISERLKTGFGYEKVFSLRLENLKKTATRMVSPNVFLNL